MTKLFLPAEEVAIKLTFNHLVKSHPGHISVVFNSKGSSVDVEQDIFISGERLKVFSECKYLEVDITQILASKTT